MIILVINVSEPKPDCVKIVGCGDRGQKREDGIFFFLFSEV